MNHFMNLPSMYIMLCNMFGFDSCIADTYWEPSRTSTLELCSESSERLKAGNYFRQTLHLNVWQGSHYASA